MSNIKFNDFFINRKQKLIFYINLWKSKYVLICGFFIVTITYCVYKLKSKDYLMMETLAVEEVVIKCEVIEISDEDSDEKLDSIKKKKKKRKRTVPKERSPCEHCAKTFQTKYELRKHLRTHTGERPYMCTTCGKTYTQPGHLSIHQLSHTGTKNFNCSECGSSFYRKADLDRHQRIHLGIKPHTCDICSKSFTQKNNLVMHVKMHIGDRAHVCSVCDKRFMTRSKMLLHSKRHEKDKKVKPEFMEHVDD